MPTTRPLALGLIALAASLGWSSPAAAWGDRGHVLVNEAAARGLPKETRELLQRKGDLVARLAVDRRPEREGVVRARREAEAQAAGGAHSGRLSSLRSARHRA